MMMFILICAQVFSLAFRGLQGEKLVQDLFALLPGGINADIWFLMLIIFILGFFIEWIEISYIAVPLFLPVFIAANVDMVWLATLICVNLQTSFLTPPFGWALFFLRGVAPPEVTTGDIYRGIVPFVGDAARRAGAVLLLSAARAVAAEDDRLVNELSRGGAGLYYPVVLVASCRRASRAIASTVNSRSTLPAFSNVSEPLIFRPSRAGATGHHHDVIRAGLELDGRARRSRARS